MTASSATALASEGTAKKQSKTEHVDGPKAAERSVRGQQQQNEPASIRANGDISSLGR